MKNLVFCLFLVWIALPANTQEINRYKKYHDKGRFLILEGKYEQAIAYLDTAIHIMPYYPAIFQDRGYAKMQLKDYDAAIRDFNHVLAKKPFLTVVKLQRGMALFHLNELDEAEADLQAVLNTSPEKNKEAFEYLSQITKIRMKETDSHTSEKIAQLQTEVERERIRRARYREHIIWNTVVPLAFWTTLFLAW